MVAWDPNNKNTAVWSQTALNRLQSYVQTRLLSDNKRFEPQTKSLLEFLEFQFVIFHLFPLRVFVVSGADGETLQTGRRSFLLTAAPVKVSWRLSRPPVCCPSSVCQHRDKLMEFWEKQRKTRRWIHGNVPLGSFYFCQNKSPQLPAGRCLCGTLGAKFDYPEGIKVDPRSCRSVRVHHFLPLLLYSWRRSEARERDLLDDPETTGRGSLKRRRHLRCIPELIKYPLTASGADPHCRLFTLFSVFRRRWWNFWRTNTEAQVFYGPIIVLKHAWIFLTRRGSRCICFSVLDTEANLSSRRLYVVKRALVLSGRLGVDSYNYTSAACCLFWHASLSTTSAAGCKLWQHKAPQDHLKWFSNQRNFFFPIIFRSDFCHRSGLLLLASVIKWYQTTEISCVFMFMLPKCNIDT